MRTCLVAIFAFAALSGPVALTEELDILLTKDDREAIKLAKTRLDELKEYLGEAKKLEEDAKALGMLGADSNLSKSFDKGIEAASYAKDGLDKGIQTLELLEKLIKLRTNLQCISQGTSCMAGENGQEKTPGCVRGYALGMSTLFTTIHDTLGDDNSFEAEDFADYPQLILIELALKMYTPALKVAAETFEKATTWGQICKTREVCELVCSAEENQQLFDCVELLDENPPLPPACLTLKDILDGKLQEKTAVEQIKVEREARHFVKHSSKIQLDRAHEQLLSFLDSARSNTERLGASDGMSPGRRSRMITGIARARSKLESAKSELDEAYPDLIAAQELDDLNAVFAARVPLRSASCQLQAAASRAYSVTLNQQNIVLNYMLNADAIGLCDRHGEYVAEVRSLKRVN